MVAFRRVAGQAETVVIVASGPSLGSLGMFPFARLRGIKNAFLIAVNHAARWLPWGNVWLTVDTTMLWRRLPHRFDGRLVIAAPLDFGRPDARCLCDRVAPSLTALRRPVGAALREIDYLERVNETGLQEDPAKLAGLNSAFGALNYAYHLKPKRVVLFGVDGTKLHSYFYGYRMASTKQNTQMMEMPSLFRSALPQLQARGIDVVNASPESAVDCFPRVTIAQGLRVLEQG